MNVLIHKKSQFIGLFGIIFPPMLNPRRNTKDLCSIDTYCEGEERFIELTVIAITGKIR